MSKNSDNTSKFIFLLCFFCLCLKSEIPKYHRRVSLMLITCQVSLGNTQNFMRKGFPWGVQSIYADLGGAQMVQIV